MIKKIETLNAPKAIGPYSQGMEVGNLIFTSGQIALDPVSGDVIGSTIEAQTHQVCKNLKGVLEAAGSSFENVIKTTCFLAEISDFKAFNDVYKEYFTNAPARSCVAVKDLPKGVLVEIEVIAIK